MLELVSENFSIKYYNKWDEFVSQSCNGTLFHQSIYLAYHGQAFLENLKISLVLKNGIIVAGLLFKEISENGNKKCISPFGSSFGGIILKKDTGLEKSKIYVELIINSLKMSFGEIHLTIPPVIYNLNGQYLEWLLLANNFILAKSDLFNVLDLQNINGDFLTSLKSKIRNQTKNALETFLIREDVNDLESFYRILCEDKTRLNCKPTHTIEDLKYLFNHVYPNVTLDLAVHKQTGATCGILYLMLKPNMVMTFYMSQSDDAKGLNGINALISSGASRFSTMGFKYLDFGSSTFGYTIENMGLSSFKENFSTKAYLRNTYTWKQPQ